MRFLLLFILLSTSLQAKTFKDFTLPVFNSSKRFNLDKALKEKKVLLNFWASWCTSCIQELPELRELKEKYGDDVVFVAINAGEKRFKIKKFLDKYDFPYFILVDKNKELPKSVGVLSLPQTFVIGEGREILYKGDRPPKKID